MSEQANKLVQWNVQAKQALRSKQVSERCKQTSEWTSKGRSTYVSILDFFDPQCNAIVKEIKTSEAKGEVHMLNAVCGIKSHIDGIVHEFSNLSCAVAM